MDYTRGSYHSVPSIQSLLQQNHLPIYQDVGHMIWKPSNLGELKLKDAYSFLKPMGNVVPWAKLIWNKVILPSRSFIVSRIMHDRMPTDEKFCSRGFMTVSMCNLCKNNAKSTVQLFCEYNFVKEIWCWLSSVINIAVDLVL